MRTGLFALFVVLSLSRTAAGATQELKTIKLPAPRKTGGKPLMEALSERRSVRDFSSEDLSFQTLSNLLWAAFGINREEYGLRTAPSAYNWQEIDIYVATGNGLYLYDPGGNALRMILNKDVRELTGRQEIAKDAPVSLVYVADFSKPTKATDEEKVVYSAADTGCIVQNVYLFCASEGLATFARSWIDRTTLAKVMRLRDEQKIILAQSVGYPGEADPTH